MWKSSPCMLVIDDDETIRELVTDVLGDEGYEVIAVPDAPSGLEAVQRQPPELILLDHLSRGLPNEMFVASYRQMPGPHAPIYLFSAVTNAPELAAQLGLAGALSKPFDIESLVALAKHHCASSVLGGCSA